MYFTDGNCALSIADAGATETAPLHAEKMAQKLA